MHSTPILAVHNLTKAFASGGNNNNLNPQPRNPWKLDRSPAGSSAQTGSPR